MPQVSDNFDSYPVATVLDGNGNGTISFQPNGATVNITRLYVQVSTSVKQASVTLYKGNVTSSNGIGTIVSGSTGGLATGQIYVQDGQTLYVVWSGGDAGATATATFSGNKISFSEMGNDSITWSDPIAASDGTLVFPAIKSMNFVAGVSGWEINRDGSFEFGSGGTIRGNVIVTGANGSYVKILNQFIGAEIDLKGSTISNATVEAAVLPAIIRASNNNNGLQTLNYLSLNSPHYSPSATGIAYPQLDMSSASYDGSTGPIFRVYEPGGTPLSIQLDVNSGGSVSDSGDLAVAGTISDSTHHLNYKPTVSSTANVSFTSATSATVVIAFGVTFPTAPAMTTNIDSGAGAAAQWNSRAINITTTGFTLLVFAAAAGAWTNIPVTWTATAR